MLVLKSRCEASKGVEPSLLYNGFTRETDESCNKFSLQNISVNGLPPQTHPSHHPKPPENRFKLVEKLKLAFFICCFSDKNNTKHLLSSLSLSSRSHISPTRLHNWPNFHLTCAAFPRSFRLFSFDFHKFSVSFQRSSINVCLVYVVPPVKLFFQS